MDKKTGFASGALVALAVGMAMPALAKVKVGKPVQFAGASTVAQAPTLVQPSTKADFSTVKRVVIPYFQGVVIFRVPTRGWGC